MALLKFLKGKSFELFSKVPKSIEGQIYFTEDEGKMYIDIKNENEAKLGKNRIPLNAQETFVCKKQYENIFGTEDTISDTSFYFGEIIPDNFHKEWHIKYELTAVTPNENICNGHYVIDIWGNRSNLNTYSVFNSYGEDNYKPLYYHNLYSASASGLSNGYGHLIGFCLKNSYQPINFSYARKFDIKVLKLDNCEILLYDNIRKVFQTEGYEQDSSNYSSLHQLNGFTKGLQETSDDDSAKNGLVYNLNIGPYSYNGTKEITIPTYDGSFEI